MSDITGLGICSLGLAPYGIGTPPPGPPLGGKLLTKTDGTQGTCRKIDSGTRQYVYDSFGRAVGEDTTPQLVKMVAMTVKASSAVASLGVDLSGAKDIKSNFVATVQNAYTTAYASLVARGLIVIRSIDVTVVPPSQAFVVVKYKDLATGLDDEVIA